jgi:hypothetical protein
VKNRFQNLPFKFNLQRYSEGAVGLYWLNQVYPSLEKPPGFNPLNLSSEKLVFTQSFVFKCNLCRYGTVGSGEFGAGDFGGGQSQVGAVLKSESSVTRSARKRLVSTLESAWFQPLSSYKVKKRFHILQLHIFSLYRYISVEKKGAAASALGWGRRRRQRRLLGMDSSVARNSAAVGAAAAGVGGGGGGGGGGAAGGVRGSRRLLALPKKEKPPKPKTGFGKLLAKGEPGKSGDNSVGGAVHVDSP